MGLIGYFNAALPFICLAFNVLIQVAACRYFPKLGLLNSVFLGFISGFLNLCLFEFRFFLPRQGPVNESIAVSIVHLVTYAALGYCYFHFINLGETARRIRILRELKDSPDGLSLNEILARYNAKEIIERRISRLLRNRQIALRNDKYYVSSPLLLYMARFLVTLKFMLMGKKSEFDKDTGKL